MQKNDELTERLKALFEQLQPAPNRIPLIDIDGSVIGSFFIGDPNAELLVEALNGYRIASADDLNPLGDPYYREWQIFRRGYDDYVYASWHQHIYCARAVSAAEAATHCYNADTRPPDILLDELAADSLRDNEPPVSVNRIGFTRLFIGGPAAFSRVIGVDGAASHPPATDAQLAAVEAPAGEAANEQARPPATGPRPNIITVWDGDTNEPFTLDTTAGPKWVGETEEWDGSDGLAYRTVETLYRRKGWILVWADYCVETGLSAEPVFCWFSEEGAAVWLCRNHYPVPEDIAHHVAGRLLDHAEPPAVVPPTDAPAGEARAVEMATAAKERKDYNALATDWIDAHQDELSKDPWFLTDRKVAEDIGCSASTANGLSVIKAFKHRRGQKPKQGRGRSPRVTSYIEGTIGRPDEALERLMGEHDDFEPSPLDDDPPGKPRRVKIEHREL